MHTGIFKLVLLTVLALAAFAAMWLATALQSPVRLRVLELTTNSHGLFTILAPPIGSQAAYALIEVTNAGTRPITYRCTFGSTPGRPQFAWNSISYRDGLGWAVHALPRRG